MRFRIVTVLSAAAIAYWITTDRRSFVLAFSITLALLALSLGVAMVIGDVSRECPDVTYTEDDLERIEAEEFVRQHRAYLAALDRVSGHRQGVA